MQNDKCEMINAKRKTTYVPSPFWHLSFRIYHLSYSPTVAPTGTRDVSNMAIRPSVMPVTTRLPSAEMATADAIRSLSWNSDVWVAAAGSHTITWPARLTDRSDPSRRNRTVRTWSVCPRRDTELDSLGLLVSHRAMARSTPTAARRRPSGEYDRPVTISAWARILAFCDPPSQPNPHRKMLLLSPALASRLPSGDQATALTGPPWPLRI